MIKNGQILLLFKLLDRRLSAQGANVINIQIKNKK